VIDANVDELGRIDAIAGDGDHGIGMQRGARAAAEAAAETQAAGGGAQTVLLRAADAWSGRAGGTSGGLWGLALRSIADQLSDAEAPTAAQVAEGVAAAAQAIQDFGKAKVGDATMVDALVPFASTLTQGVRDGQGLSVAWVAAGAAAQEGADSTAQLVPAIGRARTHAEKSVGTPDAGAVSLAMIAEAVGQVLSRGERNE
jgi:D-erythrulose 4-kinase